MYYLHHYFNPDFSHLNLTPRESSDAGVDYRNLGYVQNVVAGQVLAEILPLEEYTGARRDPRFIRQEPTLPIGANCGPHPENPNKVIALANGYCFYHDGRINVKKMLNVRGHVGFHTGNIFFLGDIAVHADVQTGFKVLGKNILVKGHIESAKVRAHGDLVCLGGAKGADFCPPPTPPMQCVEEPPTQAQEEDSALPGALLDADGDLRLAFCERVQIRARGNVIIDGSCLHSIIYAGGNVIVRGRLMGGAIHAGGTIYVEGRLGGEYTTPTKIIMGYPPFDYLQLQKLETRIRRLKEKAEYLERQAARSPLMAQEAAPRLELINAQLLIALARRKKLWLQFSSDEQYASRCRVLVPGEIMPGTEISIAHAFLKLDVIREDVAFLLEDDEILIKPQAMRHAVAGREAGIGGEEA